MSDQIGKEGPVLPETVQEVQGIFPSDAALQDAIAKLTLAGFDRADFSLPATNPPPGLATPNQGASDPNTETDMRQMRTMGTSMAGTIGAFAAAGATIATGGAAGVAIAAAAAIGAGSALAANASSNAANTVQTDERNEAAAAGQLVLAVHVTSAERSGLAERLLRESGATDVAPVTRAHGVMKEVDSTGWTG